MKYISIDTETTGLDPKSHQILQFAAIIEDTENLLSFEEIPKFNCIIRRKEIIGNPYALSMNKWLLDIISSDDGKNKDILDKYDVVARFLEFIEEYAPDLATKTPIQINVAGANVAAFDLQFLQQLPGWSSVITVNSRTIDPSILYVDWQKDSKLPSLQTCKNRAGISGDVSHNALYDAWDVIQVLRSTYPPR